jgi:hypothetical protein
VGSELAEEFPAIEEGPQKGKEESRHFERKYPRHRDRRHALEAEMPIALCREGVDLLFRDQEQDLPSLRRPSLGHGDAREEMSPGATTGNNQAFPGIIQHLIIIRSCVISRQFQPRILHPSTFCTGFNAALSEDVDLGANGREANTVLGQSSPTTDSAATAPLGMNTPVGLSINSLGTLFVGDQGNDRFLLFQNAANKASGKNVTAQVIAGNLGIDDLEAGRATFVLIMAQGDRKYKNRGSSYRAKLTTTSETDNESDRVDCSVGKRP